MNRSKCGHLAGRAPQHRQKKYVQQCWWARIIISRVYLKAFLSLGVVTVVFLIMRTCNTVFSLFCSLWRALVLTILQDALADMRRKAKEAKERRTRREVCAWPPCLSHAVENGFSLTELR